MTPELAKLRVLGLEQLEENQLLTARWLLYETRHDDHLGIDWEGYEHEVGRTWLQAKFRGRGYVRATDQAIPFGGRRPVAHSTLVGETVDGYTALLLGEGRQPNLRFVGDESSSMAITALFDYADFWPVLAEARKLSGAMGASAVVPEVREGKMTLRTLRPEHLYIRWTNRAGWIPEYVIEQKRVTIQQIDRRTGRVGSVEVWRTRAWDGTLAYAYQDVPLVAGEEGSDEAEHATPQDIELSEEPKEHRAGRCPVCWLQNTTNGNAPYGDADCEAIYEQIAQLDRSLSMVMRGSRANNDPTLVVSDTQMQRSQWPKRKKGYGSALELSEKGKAELLETKGDAIESSWASIDNLERRARRRVGLTAPTAETSGAYTSGVALQILHRTVTSRAAERRNPLGVMICQLAQTVWAICSEVGLRTFGQPPTEGHLVEMPPRELPREPGEDTAPDPVDHELGDGGVVRLDWPELHKPIPEELRTVIDALAKAVAARMLSLETATGYVLKVMQAGHDVAVELERLVSEREHDAGRLDEAMMPELDEPEVLDEGDTPPMTTGADQVQHEALNGIQTKTLGDVFARTGHDLTSVAAKFVITEGYPNTTSREAELDAAIAAQEKAAEDERAEGSGAAGAGQQHDALGRPSTRGGD